MDEEGGGHRRSDTSNVTDHAGSTGKDRTRRGTSTELRIMPTFRLLYVTAVAILQVGQLSSGQEVAGLYCAAGTASCNTYGELGSYETTGGGRCGAAAAVVPFPVPGAGYAPLWCGSYYVGIEDGNWAGSKDPPLLKPVWRWVGGEKKGCAGQSETLYACPSQRFKAEEDACECQSSGEYACTEWETGFPGAKWPRECYPVSNVQEDTWRPIGVTFLQENEVPSLEPYAYEGPEDITVRLSVQWGWLDLYTLLSECFDQMFQDPPKECIPAGCDDAAGPACSAVLPVVAPQLGAGQRLSRVWWEFRPGTLTSAPERILWFTGQYSAVAAAMANVTYRPEQYQNHWRLKSRSMSPGSAEQGPYEKNTVTVYMNGQRVATVIQILHIADVNNPPVLQNPTDGYRPNPVCALDPLTTLRECHFGQFFRTEDTDRSLSVTGARAEDLDLWETCDFNQQQCTKVDVNVVTARGTCGLNTRTGLQVYQNDRSRIGFTSLLSNANSAIQVLFYRVETQELVNTAASSILHYNTMHSGQAELITVIVSDQGSTGAEGISEIAETSIPVTIVADNDAPVITSAVLEYSVEEDRWFNLAGSVVSDVDLNEEIESSLADLDWLQVSENVYEVNRISLTAEVQRGKLYLGYLRNLLLRTTAEEYYLSVRSWMTTFPNADQCRLRDQFALGSELFVAGRTLYRSVCALFNLGSEKCRTGREPDCACDKEEACTEGSYVLVLNRSQPQYEQFRDAVVDQVGEFDRTCGGVPYMSRPNNFTFAKPCDECESGKPCLHCSDRHLTKCLPYAPDMDQPELACRCCANISHPCSSDRDCDTFFSRSMCGCSPGAPVREQDGTPFEPPGVCGPYTDDEGEPIRSGDFATEWVGHPCTFTRAEAAICRSAMFAHHGTLSSRRISNLAQTGDGSKSISLTGELADINRILSNLFYRPDLHYNRLYRIPPELRDPATFKIDNDDLDVLRLVVDDNGNSGGELRDPKTASNAINIRVRAVNDEPEIDAPFFATATEDQLFTFSEANRPLVKCPDAQVRQAVYGTVAYRCLPVQVFDPDYQDFGFDAHPFHLNVSAQHGVLFLDEAFIQLGLQRQNGGAGVECGACNSIAQLENCCRCNGGLAGCSLQLHELGQQWFYQRDQRPDGIFADPPNWGVGNQFISIVGTYSDLNRVLEGLAYRGNKDFNTRYGVPESIRLDVSDLGNMGEVYFQTAPLQGSTTITMLVDSVNDRPVVGRQLTVEDILPGVRDTDPSVILQTTEIFPIDISRNEIDFCFTLPVTSAQYRQRCSPLAYNCTSRACVEAGEYRQFIDVDEDTRVFVTPDQLWIDDVDSDEAITIGAGFASRRYCCEGDDVDLVYEERGCQCGQDCICGDRECSCVTPQVCGAEFVVQPGELIVQLEARHGLLSFFPPPGRSYIDNLVFLRNATELPLSRCMQSEAAQRLRAQFLLEIHDCAVPCEDQPACMSDQSVITMRGPKAAIQEGLSKNYLSYIGRHDQNGLDEISVWVSDQGMTDECYLEYASWNERAVTQTLQVRVVPVNDAPRISYPSQVLLYSKGLGCYVDHTDVLGVDGLVCSSPNRSKIPPAQSAAAPAQVVQFSDPDLEDVPWGNMSVTVRLGRTGSGNLQVAEMDGRISYLLFDDDDGLQTLSMVGDIEGVNGAMDTLFFDAGPEYTGYVPVTFIAVDNGNYGECSGEHDCGAGEPCLNHRTAEAHEENVAGLSSVTVDTNIGAALQCVIECSGNALQCCELCNRQPGCSYCPGDCNGAGKCMLGDPSAGPTFETCAVAKDGRGFGQCELASLDVVSLAAGVVAGAAVLAVVTYLFLRWVRRRHGTVQDYLKKKAADTIRTAKRFHLVPPEPISGIEFWVTALLAAVAVLFLAGAFGGSSLPGSCEFGHEFYLDQAASIDLSLDKCDVRFMPTRGFAFPNSNLSSVKVRFAFNPGDPDLTLSVERCSEDTTFAVSNLRPDSRKYGDYYCKVQILVPDRFVLPRISINAVGDNVTTVRGGPMDADSRDFGLEFGPNSFSIRGNFVNARLENISAKHFEFEADHGSLVAVDMGRDSLIPTASFTSQTANMITHRRLTCLVRAEYWQKKANLVCLTAANGSLYPTNNCETNCELLSERASYQPPTIIRASQIDPPPDFCPNLNRYQCDRCAQNKISTIPGCIDRRECTSIDSLQCLCKAACEMVSLESLQEDAPVPPISAQCDEGGQCCITTCFGYSKADLFPTEDQPLCGTCIDSSTMPWNAGSLDQQWIFTSEEGEISVSALKDADTPAVSSYKGGDLVAAVDIEPDIKESDKDVLDKLFHSEGKAVPAVPWFSFVLKGPGSPERSIGEFVWVADVRHLVIPLWLINVVSSFLLAPARTGVELQLDPAFCPAIVPNPSEVFTQRLVRLQNLLVDTLQTYPETQTEDRILPPNSVLGFQSADGNPLLFTLDPTTNQVAVLPIDPWLFTAIINSVAVGLVVPLALSLFAFFVLVRGARRFLRAYRLERLGNEQNMNAVNAEFNMMRRGEQPDAIADARDQMRAGGFTKEQIKYVENHTGFFHVVQDLLLDAERERSLQKRALDSVGLLILGVIPSWYVLKAADDIEVGWKTAACEYRVDVCACLGEQITLSNLMRVVSYAQMAVAVLELSGFYLKMPSTSPLWRTVRAVFYLLYTFLSAGTVFLLLLNGFWLIIGAVVDPLRVSPFTLAMLCIVTSSARYCAKLVQYHLRVKKAFEKEVERHRAQMEELVPAVLMDVVVSRNIHQALRESGLSPPKIVLAVFQYTVLQVVGMVFMFIAFAAFTDVTDPASVSVNCALILGVIVGFDQTVVARPEPVKEKLEVDALKERISVALSHTFRTLRNQVDLARQLVLKHSMENFDRSRDGEEYADPLRQPLLKN